MITCPWCGTNYITFQSNCKNCGGILPLPAETTAPTSDDYLPPPPPPRVISDQYVRRIMMTDGWAITAGIISLLGTIFTGLGVLLTLGIVTAFVGVPFIGIGVVFLGLSSPILFWRYQLAQRIINVLRHGEVTQGEIVQIKENFAVRVNRRHPWIIRYRFQMGEQNYTGVVRSLTPPGLDLQPGRAAYVLYLPNAPEQNAIYPHP